MYNRKFDIKRDFSAVNEMENKVLPMLDEIKDQQKRDTLKNYVSIIFFNQWKKQKWQKKMTT